MYRKLNPEKIISTITILNNRIYERFPKSGLNNVCGELINIANESKERAASFLKPNISLRLLIGAVIIFSLVVLMYSTNHIKVSAEVFTWGDLIQILEAGINNLILIGAALFFLFTFEIRVKRGRALTALYELRAIAHVIDMHQLTKDPGKVSKERFLTESSPALSLNAYELARYLDYSSEMLSLIGKIAALYAENLRDKVVLSAVNEIENLTTGLTRKIWQKLIILEKLHDRLK